MFGQPMDFGNTLPNYVPESVFFAMGIPHRPEDSGYQRLITLLPWEQTLRVIKQDENGQPLSASAAANARFRIEGIASFKATADPTYDRNKNIPLDTLNTTHDTCSWADLPAGWYNLIEEAPPSGYEALSDPISFRVTENNRIELVTSSSGITLAGPFETNHDEGGGSLVPFPYWEIRVNNTRSSVIGPDIPQDVSVLIRKYAKGDHTHLLPGAALALYRVEGGIQTLIETFTSDATGKSFTLANGSYVLKETTPPADYLAAADLSIVVENGKVFVDGQEAAKESTIPYSYEAYTDWDVIHPLGELLNYGKEFYMVHPDGNEVVYCFNAYLNQPAPSYDGGGYIEYEGELPLYEAGLTDFKYTKTNSTVSLRDYAVTPRIAEPERFKDAIKRVIFAGYPSLGAGIPFENTSDWGKRAATQLAIYYFTDSAPLDGSFGDGFDHSGQEVIRDAEKIVEFANSNRIPIGFNAFEFNFYVAGMSKYQNLIGTSYHPNDLVYIVRMEDDPASTDQTVSFSKVDLGGTEIAGAKIEIKQGDTGRPQLDQRRRADPDHPAPARHVRVP